MNGNKAKLKFNPNNFEIIEEGDYVICAVSGKKISLNQLTYWNVELQEPYFSPKEAQERYEKLNKKSKIENEMATVTFTNVPDGDYAVSCFHDEDDNGKLNMFMGMMPTEDYGTSNNAPANFGPPKWIDAKFEVKDGETKTFEINL